MNEPTKTSVRTIDPEIQRLRLEHRQNVENLKKTRESAMILTTIIEKRLPQMTPTDRLKLLEAIGPKPIQPAPQPPRPRQPDPVTAPRPAQPLPAAPGMAVRKPL